VISACSGTTTQVEDDRPAFRYEIVVKGDEHTSLDADTTGELLRRGAGTGVGAGTAGGAAMALSCGPFMVYCGPAFIGAGALVGAVGGATNAFAGLDEDDAEQLNALLVEIDKKRDFRAELLAAVGSAVPVEIRAKGQEATAKAELSIVRIRLNQLPGKKATFSATARLVLTARGRTFKQIYFVTSKKFSLKDSLDDEGRRIDGELTNVIRGLAQPMSEDIETYAARRGKLSTRSRPYQSGGT
jgi:hypothetical protein